jgi:predicted thioesterase
MEIKAVVRLERLYGRRIGFQVEADDDFEKVCAGTDERTVIETHLFKRKVEEKLKPKKAG